MSETKMMEEIDCGNFFDQIDDLLEFPNDEVEKGLGDNGVGGEYSDFPPVFWSENSPVFSANTSNSASELSAELSVPYEDIVQLEWLSTFVEDSFAGAGLTLEKSQSTSSTKDSSRSQFQTSSPISVLESSSSTCTKGKTLPVSHEKRARSKRRRPAVFKPLPHFLSPTSSIAKKPRPLFAPIVSFSESENFAESRPSKKKKVIKILPPSGRISHSQNENPNENPNATPQTALRRCMHCEITKTPQWRAGPMGPKTLCNACGVRYKSGRLFPEYRPAASPTFVPSLHSNSHKKVIEMRTKTTEEKPVITSELPELVPKTGPLPAYI